MKKVNLENCYCEATIENYTELCNSKGLRWQDDDLSTYMDFLNAYKMGNYYFGIKNREVTLYGKKYGAWKEFKQIHLVNNKWEYKTLFTKEVEQTKEEELIKFEDADFDYEILKEVNGMLIGYIKPDNFAFPTSWNKEGKQQQHSPQFDLTPIKKPWYENPDNFPRLMINEDKDYYISVHDKDTYQRCKGFYRLATNEEIDNLKCGD